MSFGLLSVTSVLLGVAALAIGLWLAQRLRVQHREVEVLSTIFWQEALQETRARVFVKRFRHWWAWVLLVAIASLLWMLIAKPETHSLDGTRHVVVVDWSVDDPQVRQNDLELAIEVAKAMPTADREIIAVGTTLQTLLRPGEPLELARQRCPADPVVAPRDLNWAIDTLAARATQQTPLSIHLVGDGAIDAGRLDLIARQMDGERSKQFFSVHRVSRDHGEPKPALATLGVADSVDGRWDLVDVWIAIDQPESAVSKNQFKITSGGAPVENELELRENGVYQLRGLPADGRDIEVALDDRLVGKITLPDRAPIRVRLESDVSQSLRQLITIDPACSIVDTGGDVIIGSSDEANFRLVGDDSSAFSISADSDDPEQTLADLVGRLALEQIDATGIAQQSGRVVDVQLSHAETRRIAMWKSLFTPTFDFQESRACPVLVSRSVRWLADRPAMVPWAELGQKLPAASPPFGRATEEQTRTADGRTISASRLAAPVATEAVTLQESQGASLFAAISPITWLGLLVSLLLVGEWVLYQRGHIP